MVADFLGAHLAEPENVVRQDRGALLPRRVVAGDDLMHATLSQDAFAGLELIRALLDEYSRHCDARVVSETAPLRHLLP